MADFITLRETIEYTIQLPRNDFEAESFYGDSFRDADKVKSLHREVVGRHHEPDYVFDACPKREVHILWADGVEVFAHRSHDVMIAKYRELSGATHPIELYGDLDDPDLYWRTLAESNASS